MQLNLARYNWSVRRYAGGNHPTQPLIFIIWLSRNGQVNLMLGGIMCGLFLVDWLAKLSLAGLCVCVLSRLPWQIYFLFSSIKEGGIEQEEVVRTIKEGNLRCVHGRKEGQRRNPAWIFWRMWLCAQTVLDCNALHKTLSK